MVVPELGSEKAAESVMDRVPAVWVTAAEMVKDRVVETGPGTEPGTGPAEGLTQWEA